MRGGSVSSRNCYRGKRSPTSHLSLWQRVSRVSSVTFWIPISIRFKDDFDTPSLAANWSCEVCPRASRNLFASRFARFPI